MKAEKQVADSASSPAGDDAGHPKCGVVMPISKTARHSAEHWSNVQTLLHRAITSAGFEPENVWEGDLSDRISKRIVANLFSHEIVVVDASDVNPNVMLELGLRLASKRPTVVVTDNISDLPFDIRDFEALPYPSDLNILGMEAFFDDLKVTLQGKYEAHTKGKYQSYFSDVVVEVVSPKTREVSLDSAVLDRLDEINRRVSRMELRSRDDQLSTSQSESAGGRKFAFTAPEHASELLTGYLSSKGHSFRFLNEDGNIYFVVNVLTNSPSAIRELRNAISIYDGTPGVPDTVIQRLL